MLGYETILARVAISLGLGGALGLERELRNQPAGFRTHIVLCVGSALITMVSSYMALTLGGAAADPTRIASQIVTGVGFLGAGAILRFGVSVKGLTTAANLWTTAGIGMAAGSGFYFGAVLATGVILVALSGLRAVEKVLLIGKTDRSLNLTARATPNLIGKVEEILSARGISLKNIKMNKGDDGHSFEIQAVVELPRGIKIDTLTAALASQEDVLEVEIQ